MNVYISKVIENKVIAKDIFLLSLQNDNWKDFSPQPGQFAHVKVPNRPDLLLRRPISIMDFDKANGILKLAIQIKGDGTKELSFCAKGDNIDVIFPLGHGFTLGNAKNVICVGGGVGVAPVYFCAKEFKKAGANVNAIFGYRAREYVYCNDLDIPMTICTDDGSMGINANTCTQLEKVLQTQTPQLIVACGPIPMLRSLAKIANAHNIECQISLEEKMACGFGTCMVCNCKIKLGEEWDYKRVCADGPVFSAKEVIFDE